MRRLLFLSGCLLLWGCPLEEPEQFDLGVEPEETCGRVSFGPNALVTCDPEGAFETEMGDPNPAEWIASLSAPLVAAPADVVGNDHIEVSKSERTLAGCGCLRADGLPTGVAVHLGAFDSDNDLRRTSFGNQVSYVSPKHTLLGTATSCDAGISCSGDKLELGYVETRVRGVEGYGNTSTLFGPAAGTVRPLVCEEPVQNGQSKLSTAACSFRLNEEGVCHSRCDSSFAQEVLEAAALFEDGFDSNDFGHESWLSRLRFNGDPVLANDRAQLLRVSGMTAGGVVTPPLDESGMNADWHGVVGVSASLWEPENLDWYVANGLVAATPFCGEADCWWKNPNRPISATKAAFLALCASETIAEIERNVVDGDGDGVCDFWSKPAPPDDLAGQALDNCRGTPNPAQEDFDDDGVGDLCDNCPQVQNRNQDDRFGLAGGAACELTDPACTPDDAGDRCGDADGDGVLDFEDNCPVVVNPPRDCDGDPSTADWQCDFDGDGNGDACDDSDGDGVMDADDNCRVLGNVAQTDTDGDNVGDACEPSFTFDSPFGDPTIAAQASTRNEFVFSADNPGVLTVPIHADLEWDDYDPAIDEVLVRYDAVGDSACSLAPITWTPASATSWRIETELTCTGLPSRYDHFGLKTATMTFMRRGVEVATEDQTFEVFWPAYKVHPGPATAANFARNHPGPRGPVEDPTTRPDGGVEVGRNGIRYQYIAARRPNWFYYWRQLAMVDDLGCLNTTDAHYVEKVISATGLPVPPAQLAGARWFGILDGFEVNVVYVLPRIKIVPGAYSAVRYFHATVVHECQHWRNQLEWTKAGRGIVYDFDEVGRSDRWSHQFGAEDLDTGRPYNRWRDLNGSMTFDGEPCDLDGDAALSEVRELNITQLCDGTVLDQPGADINYDDSREWLVSEFTTESFDHDGDTVPDWAEQVHAPADYNYEQFTNLPAEDFVDALTDAELRVVDWSEGGLNHGQ